MKISYTHRETIHNYTKVLYTHTHTHTAYAKCTHLDRMSEYTFFNKDGSISQKSFHMENYFHSGNYKKVTSFHCQ